MTTRGMNIFSGEPLPVAPKAKDPETDAFYRKLLDYLRRLTAKLGRYIDQPGASGVESAAMVKQNDQLLTGGTYDVLLWGTIFWQDDPFTLAEDSITINEDGRYLLHVDIAFGKALDVTLKITQNGNDISHTFTYGYNSAATTLSLASSNPLALSAGDVIQVLVQGQLPDSVMAAGSRLTILRLDPEAQNPDGTPTDAAPLTATYVVVGLNDALTHERRLAVETGVLALTDGGANSDITVSIVTNGVAFGKLQVVTDNRLLGRSAGTDGDMMEITVSTGLSLSAGVLTCTLIGLTDGDKGDITVSSSGTVWTIDDDAVALSNIVDIAAGKVLGNPGPGSVSPIAVTVNTTHLSMFTGGSLDQLGFASIATNTVLVNNTGGSAAPTALTIGSNTVLGRVAGNIVAAQVATGQIANNAVTNAIIRDGGALSVIGRSANSSGDPADISAVAASGAVLRESGSAIGFGTVATAGIANSAVTLAKIANAAANQRILGSGEAGSGSAYTELRISGDLAFSGTVLGVGTTVVLTTGAQSILGAKKFDPATLLIKGASTGSAILAYAGGFTSRTITFPNTADGTVNIIEIAQTISGVKTYNIGCLAFWGSGGVYKARMYFDDSAAPTDIDLTIPAMSVACSFVMTDAAAEQVIKTPLGLWENSALRFYETGTPSEYVGFQAPASVASSHTYTLPSALPTSNKILQSDLSGVLSWVANAAGSTVTIDTQTFTSSGTWTKPTGGVFSFAIAVGTGAGGGSGRCAATGQRGGGGGGNGGSYSEGFFVTSSLAATETVTIGGGGTGGTGVAATADGNDGTDGGESSFGSWLKASGGKAGAKGTSTSTSTAGTAWTSSDAAFYGFGQSLQSGTGGSTGAGSDATVSINQIAPGAGGGGGGITGSPGTSQIGGNGSPGAKSRGGGSSGGAGGAAATGGTNGSVGTHALIPGGGGGGGGSNSAGGGGAGGNGGFPGGGGGGGGSGTSGTNGNGGNGATGVVVVVTLCIN